MPQMSPMYWVVLNVASLLILSVTLAKIYYMNE